MLQKLHYLFLFLGLSLISCNTTKINNNEKFVIKRGLNASHWISQTEMRGAEREQYMQDDDFKAIADMGFDHVRLPVDEMHLWDEKGIRQEDGFKLLHFGIQQCIKNNLRVIVDLHVLRSHHFNDLSNIKLWQDEQAQKDFIKFWVELSDELKQYPNSMVAYEPMNEAVADDNEDWNKLINWVISEIRKLEPSRTIIMGSNRWQTTSTFRDLKVPQGDTNIILSFHTYEPMAFTHYKAPWTSFPKHDFQTQYPGWGIDTVLYPITDPVVKKEIMYGVKYFTKDSLDAIVYQAVKVADSLNLQLFCGEFGCFPSTKLEDRIVWYNDMIDIFDKYNVAWAHWNYKNDFPVVDAQTLQPVPEIVNILIKPE